MPQQHLDDPDIDTASEARVKVRYVRPMIYPYDNSTQTRWDRGELKVQLNMPSNPRPMGFCDGTAADLAELHTIAESEGAENVSIEKKILKSGREIWTVGGAQ